MKISVWDTYVKRNDGLIMHFDILVPSDLLDENKIFTYGKKYLNTKDFETGQLSSTECRFCHHEIASVEMMELIENNGFAIIEMENCN